MILAVVIFATPFGPAASWVGRSYFRTTTDCEAFISSSAAVIDVQRISLEAQGGTPVLVVAQCIDAGRDA
jgi:hypothetical protein